MLLSRAMADMSDHRHQQENERARKKRKLPFFHRVGFLSSGLTTSFLFPSFLIVHTKRPPFFTDLAQLAMGVLGDVVSVSVSAPTPNRIY
jgi:hypothetical protein